MVRSLWTGAAGMNAQQTNVDTISNNLANVNSVGYKAQGVQFKSLLYQDLQSPATTANGDPKPTDSEVGLGVRVNAITNFFNQGPLLANDSETALAIQGKGLFAYHDVNGETYYTRNGDFTWALGNLEGTELVLTNSEGNPILNTEGNEIRVGPNLISSRLQIAKDGGIMYENIETGVPEPLGQTIGLWQFNNFGGMERIGNTAFAVTEASGPALNEATNDDLVKSSIATGYLEGSSVNVATEMVNLIIAQRAYEMNSTSIQTTDQMMQTANQLKR
ncbi:MAG: flagellar hook-basal body protein [Lachnospiraceae bacterium]|nr:flagellar hook-basal body protein [Lachnospiraceae bacterium]